MKKWLITPFDYDIYQGLMPPQCPYCKRLLEHVNKKVHTRLVWNKEEKEFEEDIFIHETEYTCCHCEGVIKNIGINGVMVFYRNKGEEAK